MFLRLTQADYSAVQNTLSSVLCFVSYRGSWGDDLRKHDLTHGELKARVETQ